MRRVAVFSPPRAFMDRPRQTARNTTASTDVLLPKAVIMLAGTMFKTTFMGLAPVEPALPASPSTWAAKRPALYSTLPVQQASASAKKEQIKNQIRVLAEMRPNVLVSEICPIAKVMEVNTMGTMMSWRERMNSWPIK